MPKIIDGWLYERIPVEGCWKVRTRRSGAVMERTISPAYEWVDSGLAPAYMLMPLDEPDPIKDAEWLAEKKAEHQHRAAKRAKQACRWFIIQEGFDELLTLTYRENQADPELAKRHFKEWVRRMKRALPGFRYCAGFEPQERGAWHMHVATHKLPEHADYKGVKIEAWKLGTMVWRSIVGADNGLCFVGGKPAKWGKKRRKHMGLYKMANYVSKYILKHYELLPDEANRYSRSNGKVVKDVQDDYFRADSIGDLIALCFEVADLSRVVCHRLDRDFWLLATEADPSG